MVIVHGKIVLLWFFFLFLLFLGTSLYTVIVTYWNVDSLSRNLLEASLTGGGV